MRFHSKWIAYVMLGVILAGRVTEAANARGINIPLGRVGKYDEHQVQMAHVLFRDVRIPRFVGVPSFFAIALLIGYCCKRGFGVSVVVHVLFGLLLFFAFLVALAVVDEDSIARYSVLNFRPILTNRGALGGPYFAIYYFFLVGIAEIGRASC